MTPILAALRRLTAARRVMSLADHRAAIASGNGPERMRSAARDVASARAALDAAEAEYARMRDAATIDRLPPAVVAQSAELAVLLNGQDNS